MSETLNMEQIILESATELFLKKGFKATSTTEIAKEAGCNQALVHYYYRTKDRLFEAIFQQKIKFFVGALLDIGNEELPFLEKLEKKVLSHFEAIESNPRLPLFFLNELSANPERIETIKEVVGSLPEQAVHQLEIELNAEISKGAIRLVSVRDLLMTIVSLNIMAFMGAPMFKVMTGISEEEYRKFLSQRKMENVRIVLKSLEPDVES
jgi:AcrR family transcriptional regulator